MVPFFAQLEYSDKRTMTEQEQTCRGTPTTPMDLEGPTWPFAECYKEAFGGLPPSQQREAFKRLSTRRRNPLSPEQCAEPSPEVLACLEAVNAAYLNKKARSKAASATKRMIDRAQPQPEAAPVEAEAEITAVSDAVAAVSLEPATIVAEAEPEPAPVPAPAPPPVVVAQAQPKSLPIPIPAPAVKKPAPAATPASLPAPVGKPAQKGGGLSAMLKR